jgi:PAS domain-containing protein
VDYLLTLRHPDQYETLTEVLYNAPTYREEGGKVLGVFAAARDVTNQKQAVQAARSMIEASLDSLVAISPEGNVLGVFAAARDVTNQKQDERKIAEQQANAMDRLAELERFHRLTVGREVNMIELKKEIEYLRMLDDIDGPERGEWR